MTMRISNDPSRKAPKLARLELNRETVQALDESEAANAAGGIFRPRPGTKKCNTHVGNCTNNARCETWYYCGPSGGCISCSGNICTSV